MLVDSQDSYMNKLLVSADDVWTEDVQRGGELMKRVKESKT